MVFSVSAFANENLMGGDRVGNGGDVVICGKKIELLDIYEARRSGYEIKTPAGKNYQEMIKNLLQTNLQAIQPKRTAKYLKFLETFESEAQFMPGIKLSDVDDAGMVAIPTECDLKQIAIQLSDDERPAGQKRYTVSLDLWNKLDEFNKMSLVLHEIIYREAIEHKSSNSMVVRATVGEILKTKLDLDIFLSLSADSADSIEYKTYTWKVCELCRPAISIYTNEFNEEVINLKDRYLKLILEDEDYPTPVVDIRVRDGKILSSSIINFFRAQKTGLITYPDGEKVFITSDQDIDLHGSKFLNLNNTSIRFEYANYVLNLKNVNELIWDGSFKGKFNLQYKWLTLNDPDENYISLQESGAISEYYQKNNTQRKEILGNVFNCRGYSIADWHTFKDCKAGTKLIVTFEKEKYALDLVQDAEKIIISDSGELLINDYITLYSDRPIYIGKNISDQKDIILNPGVIEIINYEGHYVIHVDQFYYQLMDYGVRVIEIK